MKSSNNTSPDPNVNRTKVEKFKDFGKMALAVGGGTLGAGLIAAGVVRLNADNTEVDKQPVGTTIRLEGPIPTTSTTTTELPAPEDLGTIPGQPNITPEDFDENGVYESPTGDGKLGSAQDITRTEIGTAAVQARGEDGTPGPVTDR